MKQSELWTNIFHPSNKTPASLAKNMEGILILTKILTLKLYGFFILIHSNILKCIKAIYISKYIMKFISTYVFS